MYKSTPPTKIPHTFPKGHELFKDRTKSPQMSVRSRRRDACMYCSARGLICIARNVQARLRVSLLAQSQSNVLSAFHTSYLHLRYTLNRLARAHDKLYPIQNRIFIIARLVAVQPRPAPITLHGSDVLSIPPSWHYPVPSFEFWHLQRHY